MLSRISFSFELREKKFSWAQGVVACVADFTIIVTSVTQAKGVVTGKRIRGWGLTQNDSYSIKNIFGHFLLQSRKQLHLKQNNKGIFQYSLKVKNCFDNNTINK